MKKINALFLVAAMAVAAPAANAQIQKGNLMVGANLADIGLGFQSGGNTFSLSLSPKLGYFIEDNVVIGGLVDIGLNAGSGSTIFNYGIGAFGRYYIGDKQAVLLKHSRFFLEANVGISGINSNNATTNGLGLGFGPGVAYFITENIGLEALLKYNNTIGFGNSIVAHRLSLNVGFQIYLPTKKAREIYNEAASEIKD